jgi:hypothetical protein
VAQLYPRALCSLFVASYDSQGSGGDIPTRLHAGKCCHECGEGAPALPHVLWRGSIAGLRVLSGACQCPCLRHDDSYYDIKTLQCSWEPFVAMRCGGHVASPNLRVVNPFFSLYGMLYETFRTQVQCLRYVPIFPLPRIR